MTNKSNSRLKIIIAVCVMIALIVAGLGIFALIRGNKKDKDNESTVSTQESVTATEASEDIEDIETTEAPEDTEATEIPKTYNAPDYKEKYLSIITDKKYMLEYYNWQYGLSYDGISTTWNKEPTPIAITDITGDGVPELIIMYCQEYDGHTATLEIYTIKEDGNAVQIFSSGWDIQVAGGTGYFLFKAGTDDGLYGYKTISDEGTDASYVRLEENAEGKLEEKTLFTLSEYPNEDYTDMLGTYTEDDKEISQEEYLGKTSQLLDSMTELVMQNNNYNEDIYNKINSDVSEKTYLTYGEALRYLMLDMDNLPDSTLPLNAPLELTFSSGAGGWGTYITLEPDGSFTGLYRDSNMGEGGDGYESTVYLSYFSGRFMDIRKNPDNTYTMFLDYCSYDTPIGTETIEEGFIRQVYTEAYGISQGGMFTLYLPGTPISELPEGYTEWIWNISSRKNLYGFGLYNIEEQAAFIQ